MKNKYSIGEVASLLGLSSQAVRKYEQSGMTSPLRKDNHYRSFEAPDITMLLRVRFLRNLGFSLQEIKKITSVQNEKDLSRFFSHRIEELQEEIDRMTMLMHCADLQRGNDSEMKQANGFSIERIENIRCMFYRSNREIYPESFVDERLPQALKYSPPLQYIIRLPYERGRIQKGEYDVGLAVTKNFSHYVPHLKDEEVISPGLCVSKIIRHYLKRIDGHWEDISMDQEFEKNGVYNFLNENNLQLSDSIIGLSFFDSISEHLFIYDIKYYFPIIESEITHQL